MDTRQPARNRPSGVPVSAACGDVVVAPAHSYNPFREKLINAAKGLRLAAVSTRCHMGAVVSQRWERS